MVPLWLIKALPYAAVVALVAAAGWYLYATGAEAEAARRDLITATQQAAAAQSQLADYKSRAEKAAQVEVVYREGAIRTRTITKEIIREVPIRIPADACPLPDAWRVLHDAAAAGTPVDPAATGSADGGPVAPQEAAETVIENYGHYHDLAERHHALQQYVREQLK